LNLSDFDYHISQERIAQHPLPERDSSKLFVIQRDLKRFEHRAFRDIVSYLRAGDVLVLNDARVIPARLYGTKTSGGKVEIMLLKEVDKNMWEALVKGLREGKVILNSNIIAHISRVNGASARVIFEFKSAPAPDIKTILHRIGVMPLPPYIKRDTIPSDMKQYQTIYAKREGAVAAPTAGLHFTERLLHGIKDRGVDINTVTLHVGYGTFRPVTAADIAGHKMDEESYSVPEATARAIINAKSEGRRVIAVGTTVTRTLESAAGVTHLKKRVRGGFFERTKYQINPGPGKASVFIYPGYRFKVIDALITNFHQPKSTPIMLASAFAGLDLLKKAYSVAQGEGYRFFSYGDAMLIL
jgi:S-adenosylmethionine:tRNA ribosyltransferase-isomerase